MSVPRPRSSVPAARRRPAPALRTLLLLLAVCLLFPGAQALMVPQDEADLARGASGIVLGTVGPVESRYTAGGEIETAVEIAVESTVKGAHPGRTVTVVTGGGTVDGVTQVVEDEAVLAPGDRGFFLLERGPADLRVRGAREGVIPVVAGRVWTIDGRGRPATVPAQAYAARLAALGAGGDAPLLENATAEVGGGPAIASVSPSSAPAGTGAEVVITGTGFGSKASRTSAADVGFIYRSTSSTTYVPVFATGRPYYDANANGIVSWSDTRIVVRVPAGRMSDGYDGSASSGRVWVVTDAGAASPALSFAVPFGYGGIRWTRAPTYVVNNNCPGVASAATAVANAASTWNAAVSGSSFRLVNGGTTTSTAFAADGVNRVCWRPSSEFSSSSTLAVTSWWYSGTTITECDVKFNTGFAWTAGTASGSLHSVEAVMLHEFGHWLNLRDLYGYCGGAPSDVAKVMFGYNTAGFGNLNRVALHGDDVAGIRHIYGGGTPAPTASPTPTPTATTVPQAPYPFANLLPALIEAEHFDAGGEGVSYHDVDPANQGGDDLRPGEGVDIETAGGVTDVCYVRAGEYLEYSFDSGAAGSYGLTLRAANPDGVTKAVRVYVDGAPAPGVAIAPTGGWTTYGEFGTTISVPTGRHVLTLAFESTDRVNLDWLRLDRSATPTPTPTPTATLLPTPVLPTVGPVPGGAGMPTDPDLDGAYEDVNGNGRIDFADVALFFHSMAWIEANEPLAAFDFNANGRIDFADTSVLFGAL